MSQASPNAEQIERELAALGEAPPSPGELALLADLSEDDELPEGSDAALTSLARLHELAEPLALEDLSELETHRAWRLVEHRLGGDDARPSGAGNGESTPAASPSAAPGGASPRRWLFAAVGLAAAAALALIFVGPEGQPQVDAGPSAEEVVELGDQVRATLRALDDGKSESQRAAELAADYERRLAASQEREG